MERAARDPVGFPNVEFGPPLSKAETAQIEGQITENSDRAFLYALGQPDYAGAYFDLKTGVPTFAFAGDAERHRAALQRLLPSGTNYVLRSAAMTQTQLEVLQEEVSDAFEELDAEGIPVTGVGVDPEANAVEISLAWYTPDFERRLRERFGDRITVEGEGPPPPAGPTQTPDLAAAGIRLLADVPEGAKRPVLEGYGEAADVHAATTKADFEAQWRQMLPGRRIPRVAFDREVVITFHALVESGCPELLFAGLDVDMEQRTATATYVTPWTGRTSCFDQAAIHTFVVAVERDRLPKGDVTIRRSNEDSCDGECTPDDGVIKVRL